MQQLKKINSVTPFSLLWAPDVFRREQNTPKSYGAKKESSASGFTGIQSKKKASGPLQLIPSWPFFCMYSYIVSTATISCLLCSCKSVYLCACRVTQHRNQHHEEHSLSFNQNRGLTPPLTWIQRECPLPLFPGLKENILPAKPDFPLLPVCTQRLC